MNHWSETVDKSVYHAKGYKTTTDYIQQQWLF